MLMDLVSGLRFNFFDVIHLTGETAAVVVNISNQSSTKMRPKVKLEECVEYRAGSRTTTSSRNWGKLVGETVKGNSKETFNFQVKIPDEIIPSIANCEIISVEYNLKVPNSSNHSCQALWPVCIISSCSVCGAVF